MRNLLISIVMSVLLSACNGTTVRKPNSDAAGVPSQRDLEDIRLEAGLPIFAKQVNEVELADTFNDVDPTFVIGALVNKKTGEVRSFDSFLRNNSKIILTTLSEVCFKNFVEDSLTKKVSRLDFLKGKVGERNKAEVSIIKAAKVNVHSSAVDVEALKKFTKDIPDDKRDDFAVIVGYADFILSASIFRDSELEGRASGYGAQIGGKWYNKFENTSAYHRIVAVWSPLPLIFESSVEKSLEDADKSLEAITREAFESGAFKAERIIKKVSFEIRSPID